MPCCKGDPSEKSDEGMDDIEKDRKCTDVLWSVYSPILGQHDRRRHRVLMGKPKNSSRLGLALAACSLRPPPPPKKKAPTQRSFPATPRTRAALARLFSALGRMRYLRGASARPRNAVGVLFLFLFCCVQFLCTDFPFPSPPPSGRNKCAAQNDYQGRVCGDKADGMELKRYAVYPRLNEDMFAFAADAMGAEEEEMESIRFYGICQEKCPEFNDWVCDDEGYKAFENLDEKIPTLEACLERTLNKGGSFLYNDPGLALYPKCQELFTHCWKIDSDTRPIFYRCLPLNNVTTFSTEDCLYPSKSLNTTSPACSKKITTKTTVTEAPAKKNYLYDQLNSVFATVMRYFGDVQRSYHVILVCGGVGAMLIGLIWLVLLRWAAGCMVVINLVCHRVCLSHDMLLLR